MATATLDAWDELAAADPALADEYMGRVALGAELLDRVESGWWRRVALDRLALESCDECILGQVFGSYRDGFYALTRPLPASTLFRTSEFGFSLPREEQDVPEDVYDARFSALGALWRRQVRSRLAAAGEVAVG